MSRFNRSRGGDLLEPLVFIVKVSAYTSSRMLEMPPHIFATASKALRSAVDGTNPQQCIMVTGESGSGKSETVRHVVKFLCHNQTSLVERRLVEALTLLEAFGHARTALNGNSSRYGKFIHIGLGQDKRPITARVEHFGLERTRITAIKTSDELNFHIFYRLIKGLGVREKPAHDLTGSHMDYHLLTPQNQQRSPLVGDTLEEEEWKNVEFPTLPALRSSMRTLGFTEAEIHAVLDVLAAILHIGNIKLHGMPTVGYCVCGSGA